MLGQVGKITEITKGFSSKQLMPGHLAVLVGFGYKSNMRWRPEKIEQVTVAWCLTKANSREVGRRLREAAVAGGDRVEEEQRKIIFESANCHVAELTKRQLDTYCRDWLNDLCEVEGSPNEDDPFAAYSVGDQVAAEIGIFNFEGAQETLVRQGKVASISNERVIVHFGDSPDLVSSDIAFSAQQVSAGKLMPAEGAWREVRGRCDVKYLLECILL